MAHPSRRQYVDVLRKQLDRDVPISWDTDGPPSLDKEKRWKVGSAAWRMADGADWHMVLQDDITVCADLLAGLEKALDHVSDSVGLVQPFIGKNRRPIGQQFATLVQQAQQAKATWVEHRSLCWGVAIIVRTRTIPEMLDWCAEQTTLTYDARVGRYYRDVLSQATWYTWPSLVDHRDLPSLVGHGQGRTAHKVHAGSALELSWDGPVVRGARITPRQQPRPRSRPVRTPLPF